MPYIDNRMSHFHLLSESESLSLEPLTQLDMIKNLNPYLEVSLYFFLFVLNIKRKLNWQFVLQAGR